MLVSEIGEFGLIKLLAREFGIDYPPSPLTKQGGLLVGLGDDAVVTPRRDGALIWTTDTMVAGVHFLPAQSDWRDVGWKALAVNLSDIGAMGGTPYLALVTLTLPDAFCVEDAVEMYRGLRDACEAYGVTLGGGDIVRSPVFSVTIALSGWAYTARLGQPSALTRSAARPGDVVAVSGTLGGAAGGVRLLVAGSAFSTEAQQELRRAQQRPEPPVALGRRAVEAGLRCGIDVSDGLLQDLGHVATASGVEVRVDAARVPVNPALHEVFPEDALPLALSGGEDYQLILAGPLSLIEALAAAGDPPLGVIGEVVAAEAPRVVVLDESGNEMDVARGGWDHFAGGSAG